jgi:hypothetical protein
MERFENSLEPFTPSRLRRINLMGKLLIFAIIIMSFPAWSQKTYDNSYLLIKPGETAVIQLSPYSQDVSISQEYGIKRELKDLSKEAIALVPTWLRPALYDILSRVDPLMETTLSQTIVDAHAENPLYVDEVAFAIAHIPLEDISYDDDTFRTAFDPEMILENARNIYLADKVLHYAEIIEKNEGTDDFYTTVVLTVNGSQWEVPRDQYYWYIAHPKLADDRALYVNPHNGNPDERSEDGRFWRSYILATDPNPDYRKSVNLRYPLEVTDLANYSAKSGVEIPDTDSIIEVQGPLGQPMLIHYAQGKGMVYATTMNIETSENNLLDNLIHSGFGPGSILPPTSSYAFLVIKNRDPFGLDLIEQRLDHYGFDYELWDATDLANLSSETDIEQFRKIIIPGDQSADFYQILQDKAEFINSWINSYEDRVLLFSGNMDTGHESDDWNNFTMPLNLTRISQGTSFSGTPKGYPSWNDVIALDAQAQGNDVWDKNVYNNLSGLRFWTENDTVLDRIGYLTSQTLELRVGELPTEYGGPDGDCPGCVVRSPYPVRIIYQHYGNCGELQDTAMAFGRTGLIPSAGVGGITEDHVWNEFFVDDQWLPFQVSWSDGGTFIAVPGNAQDKDYDGGKDLAIVYRTRPDGKWENVTTRYSNTFTLNFIVKDGLGNPVEGAEIVLASETWYNTDELTYAIVSHTGHDGTASIEVGDFQNFYVRISSSAGNWPDDGTVKWIVCEDADAIASGGSPCPTSAPWNSELSMILGDQSDVSYDIEIDLPETLPIAPAIHFESFTDEDNKVARAKIVYTVDPTALKALHVNTTGSSYTDAWESDSPLPLYLFDKENLQLFLAGEDATSMGQLTTDGSEYEIIVPGTSSWFIAAGNNETWGISRYIKMDISMEEYTYSDETSPPITAGGSGCGCSTPGKKRNQHFPMGLLLLFPAALFIMKKRSTIGNNKNSKNYNKYR